MKNNISLIKSADVAILAMFSSPVASDDKYKDTLTIAPIFNANGKDLCSIYR